MNGFDVEDQGYDQPETLYQPLMQLRARCLFCGHHNSVGTPFRFNTDPIELDAHRTITAAQWQWHKSGNQSVRLFCVECGRKTWQSRRSPIEVEE